MKTQTEFLYILPDANGGVASVVYNLLKYSCSSFKKKVLLVRTSNEHNIQYKFPCNEQAVVCVNKYKSRHEVFAQIVRHIHPNTVVVSNDGAYDIDALRYFGLNNPVVFIFHGDLSHYFNVRNHHHGDLSKIICVSSYLQQKVSRQTPPSNDVIFVRFPVPEAVEIPQAKYQGDPIIINYVGALTDRKGVDMFPEFVRLLSKSGIKYHFNVMGDGDLRQMLESSIGSDTQVSICGQTASQTVLARHASAHVLILFSKGEGLPVCIVEAMKSGMVPVVFDLPSGISDIVQDGENGYILNQEDVEGAVSRIVNLYNDRYLLQKMGVKAKLKADRDFDPYNETKLYEQEFLSANKIARKNQLTLWQRIQTHLPIFIYYRFFKHKKK